MIIAKTIVAPLALLVALTTATVAFDAGIAAAPTAFFGDEEVVILGPQGGGLPGQQDIDTARVAPMRTLSAVQIASPEIYALVELRGRSTFVRGVDFDAFLALEDARIVEGRLPEQPHEALIGEGAARAHDLDVGAPVTLPASFTRVGVPVTIVGIVAFDGPGREEILVSLEVARSIMGLGPDRGHLIRVKTNESENLTKLLDSFGPSFTLSDVRLSTDNVVPGEEAYVLANLTNWGRVGGIRDVLVHSGPETIGRASFFVASHKTVAIGVPFVLRHAGETSITVNPTLPLRVREPTLYFVGGPSGIGPGTPYEIHVVDRNGTDVPNVTVTDGDAVGLTDAQGRASFVAPSASTVTLVASRGGRSEGAITYAIAEAGYAGSARLVVSRFAPLDPVVNVDEPVKLVLEVENRGGEHGTADYDVLVDNVTRTRLTIGVAAGSRASAEATIGPFGEGEHYVSLNGTQIGFMLETYGKDDPEIAALLDGYEAVRASGATSSLAEDAESYVSRIVGDVRAAVLALSLASGLLSAMGALAVLQRHLAEREPRIGTLKGIGATDAWILSRLTREAGIVAAAAAAIGVAAGVVIAELLDATGYVWGFGHAVHPVYSWNALLLTFLVAVAFIVGATRVLASLALRNPVDALMRGRALRPLAGDPPGLRETLEEAT